MLERSNHTLNSFSKGQCNYHVIFGGVNKKNLACNELYLLKQKVGENTAIIKIIKDAKGQAPVARSHHSSKLIGANQYLLIYGGKNESLYAKTKDITLDDLVVFNFKMN